MNFRPGDLVRVRPGRRVPRTRGKRFLVARVEGSLVHAWELESATVRGRLRTFLAHEVEPEAPRG